MSSQDQDRNHKTKQATHKSYGKLYGVGLGPGNPELLTLKAVSLIQNAAVIAYPAPDTGDSFARQIAAQWFPVTVQEIPIIVPMRVERFPAQTVYDQAAEEIAAKLEQGQDVIVLCEGDPFFYGSFMYLYMRLKDRFNTEIVPGVGSFMACAAALKRPIVARNDILTILPGTLPDEALTAQLQQTDAAAIMKVGRHLPRIRALLERLSLLNCAGYVSHASLPNQQAVPLKDAPQTAPYFSMILIYKGTEPWTL